MKIGPWHQPLLVKKSSIDLLWRPVCSKAPVSPKVPVGTQCHHHQIHSRIELIRRELNVCSGHCDGGYLKTLELLHPLSWCCTSSQDRKSFQKRLKQLMFMCSLLLVYLCFSKNMRIDMRVRWDQGFFRCLKKTSKCCTDGGEES